MKCHITKPLSDYYKHGKMADGHLNKCKVCAKIDVQVNLENKRTDPEWMERERERGREKYHRLNYRENHNSTRKSRPWLNKTRNVRKRFECKNGVLDKNIELHHWSYNDEHINDVILLDRSSHKKLHRHLCFDEKEMIFRTNSGRLLNSREMHKDFIKELKLQLN